ncbi:hypothetical protein QLL95_gp0011 [Cotonvirus japonicus]|uniref:Uncharacterized protein n=1 Tax=Cotonvirus japonicus TaxID=2811091 RepID=A0ABM7NQS8_9VIRU|nr:hypothetical protein QLL95_gp0011 [Cotonvirus japonicus]BCS82500.1 hypothetical protein [Cotonvirus japonicus]
MWKSNTIISVFSITYNTGLICAGIYIDHKRKNNFNRYDKLLLASVAGIGIVSVISNGVMIGTGIIYTAALSFGVRRLVNKLIL